MTFTESLTPEIKIGQLLFFGFNGPFMCDHARRAIREKHIGNVILFSRNFRNPEQLFSLIQELQHEAMEANGIPLFVAADQEGGQITRFTNGLTWFNGEMATRAAGGPDLAERSGKELGLKWQVWASTSTWRRLWILQTTRKALTSVPGATVIRPMQLSNMPRHLSGVHKSMLSQQQSIFQASAEVKRICIFH